MPTYFHYFPLALLLLQSTILPAQADTGFGDGYIITNQQDTLRGLVKHAQGFPYHIMEDILFKETEDSKKKRYKASDIIGFILNETVYHSVLITYIDTATETYKVEKVFMKLIIEGNINLYHLTFTLPGSGSVNNPGTKDATACFLLRKNDKEATEVTLLGFKKMASNYFADNTELAAKIKEKVYKRNDLEEIVTIYNKWARNPLR